MSKALTILNFSLEINYIQFMKLTYIDNLLFNTNHYSFQLYFKANIIFNKKFAQII